MPWTMRRHKLPIPPVTWQMMLRHKLLTMCLYWGMMKFYINIHANLVQQMSSADSRNLEAFFAQLLALARQLEQEEQRHVRENLTEAELAVFDILTRPDLHRTPAETRPVKPVARDLLKTLEREQLVLDWRKRQPARAAVRVAIEDALYAGLPERYTGELCDQKRDDLYQPIYERYADAEHNLYAAG